MICSAGYIDCSKNYPNSLRKKPFYVVCFSMDYVNNLEDRKLLDELLGSAERLSMLVNHKQANDSVISRTNRRVLANCIAGVVSEYLWKYYLNREGEYVASTEMIDVAAQIDLAVTANDKKIEVRSSFPRKGEEFAICSPHSFRIVGPYSNLYKCGEVQKDYYVSALFPMENPEDIIEKAQSNRFSVFLTGGATWEMMWNESTSQQASLFPEDSFMKTTIKSAYRVVPLAAALDAKEIKELIIRECKTSANYNIIYSRSPQSEQYSEYLPFYSVRAACGGFVDGGIPEEEGWIKVVDYGVKANKDRFVVRASGDSMLPKIHSGDYCVFERNWAGTRNGLIVLAQSRDFDADYSGKYTIKKYHSEARMTEEWEVQKTIDLIPLNSDYDTIHLSEDDDVAIIGVLVGVIDGNAKPIEQEPEEKEELGYCIRCHKHIDYSYGNNTPKYYCHECWQKWHRAGDNKLEKEKYCHRCGQEKYARYKNFTCFDYPLCSDCWKIEQEKNI